MAFKGKTLGKRKFISTQGPSKKQKVSASKTSAKSNGKVKGKDHAYEKNFIPIPQVEEESGEEFAEEDLEFFAEHIGAAGGFLKNLDEKGITRSKKEQERLHRLTKPQKAPAKDDNLPSIDSHSEDEESWSSGIDEDIPSASNSDDEDGDASSSSSAPVEPKHLRRQKLKGSDDEEMPYEVKPRIRRKSWDSEEEKGIERLPIKLQSGKLQHSGIKVMPKTVDTATEGSSDKSEVEIEDVEVARDDVAIGARFGRLAVVDIISNKSRKARIQGAKVQIASICQDIVADPENSLGLLRRLHTFCLHEISSTAHPEPMLNDILIRKLAFLSQLAVFKDVIPGYRIRPLSEKEKAEKVSQIVQRTRDFEQGLVSVYQAYLRTLERELKAKSELADTALQCICRLLVDVTHFNFRTNLMTAVVARLSRKTWDESSDLCLKTISSVFCADNTGQSSLELVRLLNRMIKERQFSVHPNVMFCLLDLRLKTELGGVRASQSKAEKESTSKSMSKGRAAARRAKGKATSQPHLSKKAQKKLKENQEIEEEMREAEAEVDREERASVQTETLKLLFVLYFRILKNERPTPLLPSALQGISRFAHLVNIDFFKDLLQVLRYLVSSGTSGAVPQDDVESTREDEETPSDWNMHQRLQCIVTAFELLSGQGEALNIDLTDFINHLYALIIPLSTMPGIESPVVGVKYSRNSKSEGNNNTPASMLFRALNLAFSSRTPSFAKPPPWRSAAFAKRLLIASLHFPPATVSRTLVFVHGLFAKEPQLEALLSTEDRIADGIYRSDVDDPQLCNPFATNLWELQLLSERHMDPDVRQKANEVLHFSGEQS